MINKTTKEMWDTLKHLYEKKNENSNMVLKYKFHSTRMANGYVASYLTRLRQVKYELSVLGEIIAYLELVFIAMKIFTKDQDVFMKCVVGWEKFQRCELLWDDFIQEDI